jgi:hypothetical protein
MPFPLIPIAILGLVGTAGVVQSRRAKKEVDPSVIAQRQMVYETALNTVKDPAKLRSLSAAYREQGLIAEADMLMKRAALQDLPEETKEARREVFRKAMASTNVPAILALANAYDGEGCTGAAQNLRKYAAGLATAEVSSDEQA